MAQVRGGAIDDLLAWEPPQVAVGFAPEVTRANTLSSRISKALSAALKGRDRKTVAEAMSLELGRGVSDDTIDKWTSEAANSHRIPLDAFIALIQVTEAHELLGFIAAPFGFAVVPEKYRDIIDLHLLEEHAREVETRRLALTARRRSGR